MGLGPSIVPLFLAVSRHVTRTYSDKALEMMGQGPSYGFLVAPQDTPGMNVLQDSGQIPARPKTDPLLL